MTPRELIALGNHLFDRRGTLLSLWQTMGENFYPERADFTVHRTIGDEFAEYLSSSYPLQVRRDLGNSFATYMRPQSIDWFHMRLRMAEEDDRRGREWMEWATATMRRAMYDRNSMFTRASKESDHDIATFGQSVKSIELNRTANGLLFRCWHLRDCAWAEDESGMVNTMHRKWKPTVAELCKLFPNTVHEKVKDKMVGSSKDPYGTINCRHIVIPAELYDGEYPGKKNRRVRWVSIYLDVENQHVMEVVGMTYFMYVVPRWQTVSGSQYAYSPATIIALPDARLLQAMTYTLLEAGEKATNPPMVAVQEAIRGDISVYAGAVTWVDAQYDERLGEVLRPLTQDKSGLPFGADMSQGIKIALGEALFLSKLTLPVNRPEMTAFEVGQYVQQYIRDAAPIFEPLEQEDNGAVCETTFDLMMQAGAFGAMEDIPQSIRGEEVTFRFESPLHDAIERQKGNTFAEALGLVSQTLPVDPSAAAQVDFSVALRDTLAGIKVPAKWMRDEEQAKEMVEADKAEEEAAKLIQGISAGAQAAEQVGLADQALGPEALAA